jgi:hypothetical protein
VEIVSKEEILMSTPKNRTLLPGLLHRTGTISVMATTVLLAACGTGMSDSETTEIPQDDVAVQENVTTEALSGNIADYLGQTVTIREEAEEIVTEYAFLMDDDQLFGGQEILVINASGESVDLVEGEDTELQVTGEVRELILADLEEEYGVTLDPGVFVDYEQQPVIVAQSVALAPDPDDVVDEPEQYYNRRIALNGEVESVLDSNILTIEDEELFGGENLLVISPQSEIIVQEDEEVTITGTLRPFVTSEIEREYNLTWDLDLEDQIEAEYSDRPVLIADEIYPSAM